MPTFYSPQKSSKITQLSLIVAVFSASAACRPSPQHSLSNSDSMPLKAIQNAESAAELGDSLWLSAQPENKSSNITEMKVKATKNGGVRLLFPVTPETAPRIKAKLQKYGAKKVTLSRKGRWLKAHVNPQTLNLIQSDAELLNFSEDYLVSMASAESTSQASAKKVDNKKSSEKKKPDTTNKPGASYTGNGTAVAVLDSGVDSSHPYLQNRVLSGACFSSTIPDESIQSESLCPSGNDIEISETAAIPCSGVYECSHGTHVAGIIAGKNETLSGIAPGTQILPVQIFSRVNNTEQCGGLAPCLLAWSSDIFEGLEWVSEQAKTLNVAAANLSLGGGSYTRRCEFDFLRPAIELLASQRVATIAAAGNNGWVNAANSPACIPNVVSVGALDSKNKVASFSNVYPFLTVLAPGVKINSSEPNELYARSSGTSMATPHVAGFWALAREAFPQANQADILQAIANSSPTVRDTRKNAFKEKFPILSVEKNLEALRKLMAKK
jgi:subtilisin